MKKIIGIFAIALLFSSLINNIDSNKVGNMSFINLATLSKANAFEEESDGWEDDDCYHNGHYGGGSCLPISQECVGDPGSDECSF